MFLQRFLCTLIFLCSLSASAFAAEATFSWLPNSEANLAGYKVYYGISSRNYTNVIDAGLPDPVNGRIQTTVDTLLEGETYYFAATAYDSEGLESDYSDEINHTVDDAIIVPLPSGQADFSWLQNTEPNLAGYKIYHGTASRTYTQTLDIGLPDPVDGRIHGTVTDLTAGETYYFAATAYDSEGLESDYSAEIVYTVIDGDTITKTFGSTPDADYPGTLADTATNVNDQILDGSATISTWSWSSPSPHKVANTTILKADLSSIPVTATIVEARIHLYQTATQGETSYTNTVHKITGRNPVISQVSGYNAATGTTWDSIPAGTTYNNVPLGLANIAQAEDSVVLDDANGYRSWSISSMVREWTANPETNFGLLINGQSDMTTETGRTFAASENSDAAIRPKLVVTYSINSTTSPATAADSTVNGNEDSIITGTLDVSNPSALPLQYTVTTNIIHGTLTVEDATGQFTYHPLPDFNGQDSFSFTATNDNGVSNTATVTITVHSVNDQPTAQTASFSTSEDAALSGQLSATDVDGNALTYVLISQATNGTVTVNADGTFTYTPSANWNSTDAFSFTANDGSADSNIATITITVNAINDLPTAQNASFTTNEDAAVNGQLSATDSDQDSLTYALTSQANNGTVTVNTSGTFTYTPAENWNGTDAFSFTANDGSADSNTATITITVNAINDLPTAQNASFTTNEDAAVNGQLSATDSDQDSLTYAMTSQANNGTVTINADGTFTYTPSANWNGTDAFSFTANDGSVDSNTATVTLTVAAINDLPSAQTASFTTDEDTAVNGQLSATDSDQDSLTYALTSQANNGAVTVNTSGTFTYTPAENWNGTDVFSFTANDGSADSNTATITITVNAINDVPVAANQAISVDAGVAFSGQLTAADQEGDSLGFTAVSVPSQGEVTLNSDGSYTYTAQQDAEGSDSFTFKANDGSDDSNIATVSITITRQETSFRFELSEIQADSSWQSVNFDSPFINPVVIARASSFNDSETGVIRVRNVTTTGLELRFQEWDSLDDQHPAETVTLMVAESGSFILDNGAMVEAGCFSTSGAASFSALSFQQGMTMAPVVMTAINTVNEVDAVTTRIRSITANGFEFMMREQEVNSTTHNEETGCYLAWEPSTGTLGNMQYEVVVTDDQITENAYTISYSSQFVEFPLLLAAMQTTNGADTAVLRISSKTIEDMSVFVSEEQSSDSEITHTAERGGYIAIATYDPLGDPDGDSLSTTDEENIYNTHPGLADTDNDGIDDGAEITFWLEQGSSWNSDIDNDGLINLLDRDADNDGMFDGSEVAAGFDPADPTSVPSFPLVDAGEINVDHNWVHVELTTSFVQPVIVAKLISNNDPDPCVVRIANTTPNGFDIRLQEYGYQDDIHAVEQVSFTVMEAGSYTLSDGTRIEAATFQTNATNTYKVYGFTQTFQEVPVVITAISSSNEEDTVTGRTRKITTTDFNYKMQEQEANKQAHLQETISFIAWEPSVGSESGISYEVGRSENSVTHQSSTMAYTSQFNQAPLLLTDMQTNDGGDTASLRLLNNTPGEMEFFVQEEQSKDDETGHTTEVAGFIAIQAE